MESTAGLTGLTGCLANASKATPCLANASERSRVAIPWPQGPHAAGLLQVELGSTRSGDLMKDEEEEAANTVNDVVMVEAGK